MVKLGHLILSSFLTHFKARQPGLISPYIFSLFTWATVRHTLVSQVLTLQIQDFNSCTVLNITFEDPAPTHSRFWKPAQLCPLEFRASQQQNPLFSPCSQRPLHCKGHFCANRNLALRELHPSLPGVEVTTVSS